MYGMRYGEYVGILIKAVQELSAKNEELSAKVEALENE
jgi:outer membrane murein-binding lipoprotein Lpp